MVVVVVVALERLAAPSAPEVTEALVVAVS
jgi:hypothetical protein